MKNKFKLTEENLIKFTTNRGILLTDMYNNMVFGKQYITKCKDGTFKRFVPKDGYFSVYKVED